MVLFGSIPYLSSYQCVKYLKIDYMQDIQCKCPPLVIFNVEVSLVQIYTHIVSKSCVNFWV